MYFDSFKKNECSGCTACMSVCPKLAITMQEDDEGFLYPHIDDDTCIHCGLCRKVCSWEHPKYENSAEPITLASVLKDKEERQRSTSGGVFYAIAEWIIEQGGVVYGAAFDEKLQLHHIEVDNLEDLQKLRGSKYVQSNLGHIFKDVKTQLEKGRWCYFTGTGCQVAGLKAYLRKDYMTLITSDLVCHGVPSQKLFDQHIAYLEDKYYDRVINYQFRNNRSWGGCEIVDFANRKQVKNPSYELSPYLYSFMYAMTYRHSCYECRFAQVPRQGDITLADFWGVKKFFPQIDTNHGVSLVLVNTEQGKKVWDLVKENCEYYQSSVDDGAKYNGNLVRKSEKPAVRDSIYEKINELGYKKVAESLFKSPRIWRIKVFNYLNNSALLKPLLLIYKKTK